MMILHRYGDAIGMSSCHSAKVFPAHIHEQVGRLGHSLLHTLRVTSSNDLIRHVPRGMHTFYIEGQWGILRQDYCWRKEHGHDDFIVFRSTAAAIAAILVHRPIPTWAPLLPGPMNKIIGSMSNLYLADYWVLVLHYLVWSKKLPYSIKAQWVQGSSINDERFYFVSELPLDVAETSKDAIILFEEAAHQFERRDSSHHRKSANVADDLPEVHPPVYVNGRWRMDRSAKPTIQQPIIHLEQQNVAKLDSLDASNSSRPPPPDTVENLDPPTAHCDDGVLMLDEETFTVRFGSRTYQFTQRSKQLFALLERIHRRPGARINFDTLRGVGDVWDGAHVEDTTIRGAVTRLRKTLRSGGLQEIAGRITTGTYRNSAYVVLKPI